ncbi:Phage-related protein [Methylorubrum extorquens AM1]|uniref:Phage-related protein n=2 Tax=Methylorubrum extorquens TaxID=408 RepID=C5B192_METEA|nr:Phage-related protein [Methylorubrum extorquens AM1]
MAYGYEADTLVMLCEAVLAARQARKLQPQQLAIAQQCELIMRGLARVGIVALVDEATGYQTVRKRDALAKILEAYISKELLPWAQRFPLEFYEEIYRLHSWDDLDPRDRSKPGYVGKLTNALVYERLPDGVLEQLRAQNPVDLETGKRKFKHHQFLTDEIGNPHLEKHLSKVIGLMQASDTWIEFKKMFRRVFKVQDGDRAGGRGSIRI